MVQQMGGGPQGERSEAAEQADQFVGFYLGDQQYAIPIGQIQEIVIPEKVTVTPQVADFVEGVSNLRGQIIPIINLRKLMGLETRPRNADTRTIVVNVGQRTMGCDVDTVTQVQRVFPDKVQPAPETVMTSGAGYILGFVKLDSELLILLDIAELLAPERLGLDS